jgi:hypothetical protein
MRIELRFWMFLLTMALAAAPLAQGVLPPSAPLSPASADAGSKVWIDRHAEFEAYLRAAQVMGEEDTPIGVTKPRRLLLQPGGLASAVVWSNVHGRHMGYWDSYRADIAAYEMDKLLGLNMVPPIVEKRHKGESGRASMWVENTRMWKISEPITAPDQHAWNLQIIRMKMFDNLIGNTDRNQGNLLVDPAYNLILIDHTRAFTAGRKLLHAFSRVDRELWERIEALTPARVDEAIGKWVMKGQRADVFKRRDLMRAEIERLRQKMPESFVFVTAR